MAIRNMHNLNGLKLRGWTGLSVVFRTMHVKQKVLHNSTSLSSDTHNNVQLFSQDGLQKLNIKFMNPITLK